MGGWSPLLNPSPQPDSPFSASIVGCPVALGPVDCCTLRETPARGWPPLVALLLPPGSSFLVSLANSPYAVTLANQGSYSWPSSHSWPQLSHTSPSLECQKTFLCCRTSLHVNTTGITRLNHKWSIKADPLPEFPIFIGGTSIHPVA